MIENKPTTSNELCKQHSVLMKHGAVLLFCRVYIWCVFIANAFAANDYIFFLVRFVSVWHFLFFSFAFYTPRDSCSRVRLNR